MTNRFNHWGVKPKPEENNGIPLEMPANCRRPLTMEELVAKYLHAHFQDKGSDEPETWEEANDFEPEDDEDTLDFDTRYTVHELRDDVDPTYNPDRPATAVQEAPQEEIVTKEGPNPSSQDETPSGASE